MQVKIHTESPLGFKLQIGQVVYGQVFRSYASALDFVRAEKLARKQAVSSEWTGPVDPYLKGVVR